MLLDIKDTGSVVSFVRDMERQAENAFSQKNFRMACHCYKEAIRVTTEHLNDALKFDPDGQANEGQVYLSESTKRWFNGLTKTATEMLPKEDKVFFEAFNQFHFRNVPPSDPLELISLAKRYIDSYRSFIEENFAVGKVPQPLFEIMHDYTLSVSSRRVTLARLKECKERIKKCQRLMRGFLLLDVSITEKNH